MPDRSKCIILSSASNGKIPGMEEVNPLLQTVASELFLRVVQPLAGGEFGAVLVVDGDGRELVMKALPTPDWASRFARGAELAQRLRERGYPASNYVGIGSTRIASWSLQEVLPGRVPDSMTIAHARRLVDLASMHAGAAGRANDWRRESLEEMRLKCSRVVRSGELKEMATELVAIIESGHDIDLLQDSIVHRDFHHRNYLATGDEVTGVFDWELASVGDWRSDLVTLAFWSVIASEQVPRDVAGYVAAEMRSRCPPNVVAFFAACRAVVQLDFAVRVHPDSVSGLVTSLEERIAPWWREAD